MLLSRKVPKRGFIFLLLHRSDQESDPLMHQTYGCMDQTYGCIDRTYGCMDRTYGCIDQTYGCIDDRSSDFLRIPFLQLFLHTVQGEDVLNLEKP